MALVVQETTRSRSGLPEAAIRGLMSCRDEFGPLGSLQGATITVLSPMTCIVPFFKETLTVLGAGGVRWAVSNICSSQDQIAIANAGHSSSFFTWTGVSRLEYWQCIVQALDWPSGGPDLIIDDVGDATLLILQGVKAEVNYAQTGQLPDPCSTDNAELQTVLTIIRDGLMTNSTRYLNMKQRLVGVCLGITNCVEKLLQMQADGIPMFPVFNINDSVTHGKFSYLFGCRYALLSGIKRATNMTISGKRVLCGYDDEASEGCAIELKNAGAEVVVYVSDPKHVLRARLRGFSNIISTLDYVVPHTDIFVTNCSNIDVFKLVKKMKNNAIIFITDPILDHNIGNTYVEVENYFSGMTRIIMDPQSDKWISFGTDSSSVIVLRNKGYPSFMTSWSSTILVVAILELWSQRGTGNYHEKVYDLPKHLEDKVSSLHLPKLTKTTNRETIGQADDLALGTEQDRIPCGYWPRLSLRWG